jgi:hypothetical protein
VQKRGQSYPPPLNTKTISGRWPSAWDLAAYVVPTMKPTSRPSQAIFTFVAESARTYSGNWAIWIGAGRRLLRLPPLVKVRQPASPAGFFFPAPVGLFLARSFPGKRSPEGRPYA